LFRRQLLLRAIIVSYFFTNLPHYPPAVIFTRAMPAAGLVSYANGRFTTFAFASGQVLSILAAMHAGVYKKRSAYADLFKMAYINSL
jgi:hypothetical protein